MDSPAKSFFNPNKHLKEQFVSNLNGCSMFELFVLTSMISATILVRRWIGFHGRIDHDTKGTSFKKNDDAIVATKNWSAYMSTTAVDFLIVVLPIIMFLTVLADWIYINAIVLVVVLLLCVTCRRYGSSVSPEGIQPLRTYISSYRVTVMLVTCICILAVDFKIYPRRYAKTETYGTSVMDLGVGAYILANSLVSRQARGISRTSLKKALQSISPLLFLGFARLVSTAGVNYQVHVGEYGVHWNFFFTLAAVSILTSIVNIPPTYCGIIGSLTLIGTLPSVIIGYSIFVEEYPGVVNSGEFFFFDLGYQVCLMRGLNVYLLSEKRETDIISQNKEGIYSIFGYWGMYLVGVQLGNYLFFGNHSNTMRANKWARIRVWILALLFWLLTLFLDRHVERPSRRMCNLAYVTNVLAVNLQMLAIVMLADFIPGSQISILEEAFNRNLLGTFLAANLMTGFVNLSIDTLFVSAVPSLIILSIYAFILSTVVVVADFYGFKLKFW